MQPAPAPGAAASTPALPRPEIVAPAGDLDSVHAAVENGADAVYFGLRKFNARLRAPSFAVEELPGLLSMLRLRGVKGYVTFNTLAFPDEIGEVRSLLEKVIAAGPAAIMLQDLGLARLAREISPDVPLHASTQATTTSAEPMGLLRDLGFSRVILARELSLEEIRKIRAATAMELEVFVHGALCVAYSGQCFTSEALGGRSANRGVCAQACRLPYEMIVDGRPLPLGDLRYLTSPLDLMALGLVPRLLGLADALKIEGRLKTPEYVAATVRAYRRAVDAPGAPPSREELLELQQVFSRGFHTGFLDGTDPQALVRGDSPKKRGVFLGRVDAVRGPRVALRIEGPLKPGDGVVFDYGRPDEDEPGGRVVHLWVRGRRAEAADAPEAVEIELRDCPSPRPGWKVWKTDDPALRGRLRAGFQKTVRRVPVDALAEEADGLLRVTLTDGTRSVSGDAGPVQPALKRPLTAGYLREHLGRLGDTPFELRGLDLRLGNVMVPVSRINDLRRRLGEELAALRRANPGWRTAPATLERFSGPPARTESSPRLVALCRTPGQVDAALAEGVRILEGDFADPRAYRDAVARARRQGASMFLAPPRILKPGEEGLLRALKDAGPDGILARSLAHVAFFRREAPGLELGGDASLNAVNGRAAEVLFSLGLSWIVPGHDLNWERLQAFLGSVDPGRCEVVVHQHMPLFHMEHCLFAARLSKGRTRADCGRPCEGHEARLRDRAGMEHPLEADALCRNTLHNAVPQSASPYLRGMIGRGVRRFRVEFLRHPPEEAARILRGYRAVIEGREDGLSLWKELRASSVMGVTRGPLGQKPGV
jgi:putative protease